MAGTQLLGSQTAARAFPGGRSWAAAWPQLGPRALPVTQPCAWGKARACFRVIFLHRQSRGNSIPEPERGPKDGPPIHTRSTGGDMGVRRGESGPWPIGFLTFPGKYLPGAARDCFYSLNQ